MTFLEQIEENFRKNNYEQVIELYQDMNSNEISLEEQVQSVYYYSRALYSLRKKEKAFEVLVPFENRIDSLQPTYLQMIIINAKMYNFYNEGNNNLGFQLLNQWKSKFDSLDMENNTQKQWYAVFLHVTSLTYLGNGSVIKSREYNKKALELRKKLQKSGLELRLEIATCIQNLGFFSRGEDLDDDASIPYFLEALEIFREINNLEGEAICYFQLAVVYFNKYEIDKTIEFGTKSFEILRKLGTFYFFISINLLIDIYMRIGDFDQVLKYLNLLELHFPHYRFTFNLKFQFEMLQGNLQEAEYLLNTSLNFESLSFGQASLVQYYLSSSDLYLSLNKFEKSKLNLEQALDLLNNQTFLKRTILVFKIEIIRILLELGDVKLAQSIFEDLSKLEGGGEELRIQLLFAQALLQKANSRISIRLESLKLFKELINMDISDYFIKSKSIMHSIELLLLEYKIEENQEVLDEINLLLGKLEVFASEKKNVLLVIDFFIISAKLAIIEGDLTSSFELLDKASSSVEKINHPYLKEKILSEKTRIYDELKKIRHTDLETMDLQKKLELSQIESYIDKAQQYINLDPGI